VTSARGRGSLFGGSVEEAQRDLLHRHVVKPEAAIAATSATETALTLTFPVTSGPLGQPPCTPITRPCFGGMVSEMRARPSATSGLSAASSQASR